MLRGKKNKEHLINEVDVLKRNILFRVRTFEGVNYLFGQGLAYELNEVANMVWEGVNGLDSVLEIEEDIAKEYGIPVDEIREGIFAFLDEMMAVDVFKKVEE